MLTSDTLTTLLHALVTGFPERALNVVAMTDELTEEERAPLWHAVQDIAPASEAARAVGDAIRVLGGSRDLVNECYRAAFYASDAPGEWSANPLFALFSAKKGGLVIDKWPHYFLAYDRHLARYRGTDVRVLEIGTYRGGGLDLLRGYLGDRAVLVGADIDPVAVGVARERHTVELGDQTDVDFLLRLHEEHGPFDVVIDDGGHTMDQQLTSLRALLPLVAEGGVYLVEDTHTSYWPEYDGGVARAGTFMEWTKGLLDELHAHHWSTEAPASEFAEIVSGVHVYDSVVVLDRGRRPAPFAELAGTWDFLKNNRPLAALQSELVATRDVALKAAEEAAAERDQALSERQEALAEQRLVSLDVERLAAERDLALEQVQAMRGSTSWRLTRPLRALRGGR